MILIGLTGSIGMGKSTTARMFAECGVPVFDADAAVHKLYDFDGAAVEPVGKLFPDAVIDGRIDRGKLSSIVIGKPSSLKALEKVVHPLVREADTRFLEETSAAGRRAVVLDIPLLLESKSPRPVDIVVVVSAPAEVQADRVLARPEMTRRKFQAILAKQMPDEAKRKRAHFVVETGGGLDAARKQIGDILRAIAGIPGKRR